MRAEEERPLEHSGIQVTFNLTMTTTMTLLVVGVAYYFLGGWIDAPLSFMEVWTTKGSLSSGLAVVWPIFVWGIGLTLLISSVAIIRRVPREYEPSTYLINGTWLSLNAGFFEEIIYRWLRLFGAMIGLNILNVITFGLVEWIYTAILIPIANWASFGILDPQLGGAYEWLFAAAIVSANIRFRDAHEYQGTFGMINAWYMGLVFFYLTFNYGLWIAIVVHALYDITIFWTRGLMALFQQRNTATDLARLLFSWRN